MLNCIDASHVASEAQERSLSAVELIGLKFHLIICKGCRGFSLQLKLIRLACQRIDESKGVGAEAPGLDPDAKSRILKELASKRSD